MSELNFKDAERLKSLRSTVKSLRTLRDRLSRDEAIKPQKLVSTRRTRIALMTEEIIAGQQEIDSLDALKDS